MGSLPFDWSRFLIWCSNCFSDDFVGQSRFLFVNATMVGVGWVSYDNVFFFRSIRTHIFFFLVGKKHPAAWFFEREKMGWMGWRSRPNPQPVATRHARHLGSGKWPSETLMTAHHDQHQPDFVEIILTFSFFVLFATLLLIFFGSWKRQNLEVFFFNRRNLVAHVLRFCWIFLTIRNNFFWMNIWAVLVTSLVTFRWNH